MKKSTKENAPKVLLVVALVAVVGMGFRVSWNALRDIATAIGADHWAALLYPFVVDGLMALALVATLVLTDRDRRFALWVLGGYTAASLALNYVHGLVPTLHGGGRTRLAEWAPAHWALVLLASSLPVGSIYFGSDLVAKVLHAKPKAAENAQKTANRSMADQGEGSEERPLESVYESADRTPEQAPSEPPAETAPVEPPVESAPVIKSVAAEGSRPRRATGRVPQSARAARPVRSFEELLTEARDKTADWSEAELTGEAIRLAVRTSAAKARELRDALKAERNTAPDDGEPEALAS
ncbi:DUF2637 domain-containing protein [Kitasatospora sp. NPDC101157]|uniref:DUF2637 domain-containing protein n=1 Tax=Kitasatospora sp. NPDC101157 TaxID=3364098 RepID=UPI00380C0FB3